MTFENITFADGKLVVPDKPVVPFIEGDGIGPDIWKAASRVIDHSVQQCWGDSRKIGWKEVLAGEKALTQQVSGYLKKQLNLLKNTESA
jgi:isocitrate dehydrogenase